MVSLVHAIKKKQELSTLQDGFVQEKLDAYFDTFPRQKEKLETNGYNEKSFVFKEVVKAVRAKLREVYGVFQTTSMQKRYALLEQYKEVKGRGKKLAVINKLLASHQSTKERKEYYKEIYDELFTLEPAMHILDLGCGFNPLAYHWLPHAPKYTCCDISEEDMQFLNEFFSFENIPGRAFALDLLRDRDVLQTIRADTVLMLKLVDTLESQERNATKIIITELFENKNSKRIIISFPIKSIGGRTFREGGKENWFSKFLTEKKYSFTTKIIADEEFYIIEKA